MKAIALIGLLLSALLCRNGTAQETESLAQLLRENEVRLSDSHGGAPARADVLVITEVRGDIDAPRADFIGELVRHKLSKAGIRSHVYRGNFRKEFERQTLDASELLSPKVVVEVVSSRVGNGRGYTVDCSMQFVTLRRRSSIGGSFVSERIWGNTHQLKGVLPDEMEDAVGRDVKRISDELIRDERAILVSQGEVTTFKNDSIGKGHPSSASESSALKYRLRWTDPDNRRGSLFVGAAVGTPALLNLSLGYWGTRSVPLVAGLTGMYYTAERRGVQADIGWAFDNEGSTKQVVSVVGALFNGTTQVVTNVLDIYGRVTQTTTDTFNDLHPYVGAAYAIRWNDFRLQGGVAFRVDSSSEPSVRFLIQLGYAPALRF